MVPAAHPHPEILKVPLPRPSCDMAQDKERELINSATEAARQLLQLIDVIFDINCAANK